MTHDLKNLISTCKPSDLDGCAGEVVYANWRLRHFPVKTLETMLIRHGLRPGVSPRKSRKAYHRNQVARIIEQVYHGYHVVRVTQAGGAELFTIHSGEVDPITHETRLTQTKWIRWNPKNRQLLFQYDSHLSREVLNRVASYNPIINTTTSKRFQVSLWTDYCNGVPFAKFDHGQYKHIYFVPRAFSGCVDDIQTLMEDTATRYDGVFAGLIRFPVKTDAALVPILDRELASLLRRRMKPVVDYARRRSDAPTTFYTDDDENWETRRWSLDREYGTLAAYETAFQHEFEQASGVVDTALTLWDSYHKSFTKQREGLKAMVKVNPNYKAPSGRKPRFLKERATSPPYPNG